MRPVAEPPGVISVRLTAPKSELRALIETYYDIQKLRVAGNNRRKAVLRGEGTTDRLDTTVQPLRELEKQTAKYIATVVKDEAIYSWLISVRGCGPVMAGALIASGLDPTIDKPSGWWRFAGVGVVDGKNQRKRRGQKLGYNGFLRRTLEVLVTQFLKAQPSFYSDLYYSFKADSERGREGLAPIHHHRRAVMLTQRVFLTHLLQRWREALGLPPPRSLYIVEKEPGVHSYIEAP